MPFCIFWQGNIPSGTACSRKVVTADGTVLFTGQDIKDGQNVWQSMGGQEMGTVWGHGAYLAPDWSADWLHKEAVFMLDKLALNSDSTTFDKLSEERKAALKITLAKRTADQYL